jgi:hypothetical protein
MEIADEVPKLPQPGRGSRGISEPPPNEPIGDEVLKFTTVLWDQQRHVHGRDELEFVAEQILQRPA